MLKLTIILSILKSPALRRFLIHADKIFIKEDGQVNKETERPEDYQHEID